MLSYYENTTRTRSILSLCEHIWGSGSGEDKLKIGKIKKFLSSISMGLRPNQIWSGYPQDFGGLLLVKENGDVLFYYLYNLKLFEEYLYSMLKFDTPSTSRHGFGQLYEVQGKQFIKLNLQIRF
jgi:type II restriction enzyme